jgi:hypothetical protein
MELRAEVAALTPWMPKQGASLEVGEKDEGEGGEMVPA